MRPRRNRLSIVFPDSLIQAWNTVPTSPEAFLPPLSKLKPLPVVTILLLATKTGTGRESPIGKVATRPMRIATSPNRRGIGPRGSGLSFRRLKRPGLGSRGGVPDLPVGHYSFTTRCSK